MRRTALVASLFIVWLGFVSTGSGQVVSNTSLHQKLIVGYQGWFGCAGDGSLRNNWFHWEINKSGGRRIPATDLWPDMTEYTETYNKGWTLRNNQPAAVFSSYDASTVDLHFKWMKQYAISGAFVGRQTSTIAAGGAGKEFRDQVLKNVAAAANNHGRIFYINYDISGEESNLAPTNVNGNIFDRIDADFQANWNTFSTDERARYVQISGKPLIRIFGVGSERNQRTDGLWIFNAAEAKAKLDALNNKYTIMLSVPKNWRTLDGSGIRSDWIDTPEHREEALDVWRMADYIQPWVVNAFNSQATADSYYRGRLSEDIQWGLDQSPDVKLAPIVWAGFSWRNKNDGLNPNGTAAEYDVVPRGDGSFFWNNGYEAIAALRDRGSAIRTITVAMFDEMDEGTAIMKLQVTQSQTPNDAAFSDLATANAAGSKKEQFVTTMGGPDNEPDYFLWLTKQIKSQLSSSTGPSPVMPDRNP